MPSLLATLTQLIVLHSVGSSVVDDIGLAPSPEAQAAALARYRASDHPAPPKGVARGWQTERLELGAPLHVLRKDRDRVLLYLHGGAYVIGPNAQQWRTAAALADAAEMDLAVLSYGLAPEADVVAGIRATLASMDALGARYEQLSIFADSAGAGLAVAGLQAQRDRGGPQPALTVLFSPWVDAALDAQDVAAAESQDVLLSVAGLQGCARLFGGALPLEDPRLSPARGDLHGLPPIVMHIGSRELLAPDVGRFHEALQSAGVDSELHTHPGMQHDFVLFPCREARAVMRSMAARLGE
jgi:monoterpene epsilon-lactone hydrolase